MAIDLLSTLQNNLGEAELKKVDPNTQQTVEDGKSEDKLNQAAIPAVLISMYKYAAADEGAQNILSSSISNDWLEQLFGDKTNEAVKKIADYANVSEDTAKDKMELVSKQAIGLIKESNPTSAAEVKTLLAAEKQKVLTFLPAQLNMGELLDNNTLDDKVNKMEGPVSSFIHNIGEIFSQPEKPGS